MIEQTATAIEASGLYEQWGLTSAEYQRIQELLGRLPNFTETGLFAAMWSEHCAYKNSKLLLKQFPTSGQRILQGPGEGAGIIDIGDGQAVVFKAESHNHPTAVEPYQGAATGVGGIIRDIFSMGAQPIALLDSLRFGELTDAHTRFLLQETVAGIGGYGNCIGIPTVGGELAFDDAYAANPVMNAMCVGLLDTTMQQKGQAAGAGNLIYYVGAKTGRDGIQGAIFASAEFNDAVEADRSAVQVGDPFMEKRLMDACLELIREHPEAVVGIQDMGAAGLVSSSAEMGAKADYGMTLNLDAVPQREAGMIPYELMLSESQERMLLCVAKDQGAVVEALFARYELDAVQIGEVTAAKQYQLYAHGEKVADVPIKALVDEAPVYQRPQRVPARLLTADPQQYQPQFTSATAVLTKLLQQPTLASKQAIYRSYDTQVKTNTVVAPGSDAAVLRIRGGRKALAMTTDGNGRYLYLNPEIGGQIAVCEAARNIVASGGVPLGITDCLNFGSPEEPESFYELAQATKGMSAACKALATPVISGNVSLYNESNGTAIYPTPMVGMVGLITDLALITTQDFKQAGDVIFLVGQTHADFNGSELQKMLTGNINGALFDFDLATEIAHQQLVQQAIRAGLVSSAHDLAEGGLAVGLAECCFGQQLGASIDVAMPASWLFAETQSRFIITVPAAQAAAFSQMAGEQAQQIGTVTAATDLVIKTNTETLTLDIVTSKQQWEGALAW
ncbi:phosphoribosylformylglycinamidine synthase subunit PurL [Loigolactobacillus coryniformis]|uniref:Phosphoribosylformylglycinamidine synthase subunit PurL n=1 Tax=Loigolactobacillus coryniformis subsp. torquens DSM 20004 = KCTC 3535 TaxID=1423822 RepID=A0A2D1KNB5_9LACO|nr:phosphoribosylformylglycinamidine synthase subunit PurL [Loigolactobacillus coryniformis]ATO43640.1 phosphoribosylformylglycinamidine synthase II [Loigolactobacillus coryniformis subsp. torquens DSM 20004 = KCTC 3535]KRK83894.1 phosphoribosylformylglycinamidine synthase domain-containing protein [Loigolactobacillus coryniformis subsp. torquens DSM 20004 = KCTC 3535]MDN5953468.1 phosphoribosylformylglycinamidine synthase subunit PurL [Loigolactobacillus coryniformis]